MNMLYNSTSNSLFYYVNVPVATMREHPNDSSEVVSQAYFSEQIVKVEEAIDWVKIKTVIDSYQGWIKRDQICHRPNLFLSDSTSCMAKVNRFMVHLYSKPDTIYGPMLTLPFESKLEILDFENEKSDRWIKITTVDGRVGFIQRGDVILHQNLMNFDQLCSFSLQFLGLPYTWGGRSSFGYDCSGFVQMLYRQAGIHLPRDSKDQVKWSGFNEISIEDLSPGNLIFFGLNKDNIQHVGMYLGKDQFIHATVAENAPYIHISCLSDPEWNGSGKWIYHVGCTLKKENIE